ncbi:MAG: DUF3422 domain-containing protein [Silicimonas sp.]|nr:DUF3422 domain-containing protein [Silicimonas sp.]
MAQIQDYDSRYQLANELHARPFPVLKAPCTAAFLAFKQPKGAALRDREADRAHLIALLDRHGAPHPTPGATHYFGEIGRFRLKWESHTEFVTYTIFSDELSEVPFDASAFSMVPEDWLDEMPGKRITSALIRVEVIEDEAGIEERLEQWFVPESLTISRVLDDQGIVSADFRIDQSGHMRFALFVRPEMRARRIGRVVQRICEVETYKAMSMLGLIESRTLGPRLGEIDDRLTELMAVMSEGNTTPEETLQELLQVSEELETLLTRMSFRFGATRAYEALVNQRIEILREARYGGRETWSEFMLRRFDPAMRTVKATENRLNAMAERATRAANLLRTRVDVERSAQNQAVLASMDRRAALQLRLQRTVEGLSVVAISYYAVNLMAYLTYPAMNSVGMSKGMGMAVLTPIVLLLVWFALHRIRRRME